MNLDYSTWKRILARSERGYKIPFTASDDIPAAGAPMMTLPPPLIEGQQIIYVLTYPRVNLCFPPVKTVIYATCVAYCGKLIWCYLPRGYITHDIVVISPFKQ